MLSGFPQFSTFSRHCFFPFANPLLSISLSLLMNAQASISTFLLKGYIFLTALVNDAKNLHTKHWITEISQNYHLYNNTSVLIIR